jgi:hypothetical protein
MTGLVKVIDYPLCRLLMRVAGVACALLLAVSLAHAQPQDNELELQSLSNERATLTAELDQYKNTVRLLQTDGSPPEQSSNPAVRKLALEMVGIKERLIAVTERELTLLQEQITSARQLAEAGAPAPSANPLRVTTRSYRRPPAPCPVRRNWPPGSPPGPTRRNCPASPSARTRSGSTGPRAAPP